MNENLYHLMSRTFPADRSQRVIELAAVTRSTDRFAMPQQIDLCFPVLHRL